MFVFFPPIMNDIIFHNFKIFFQQLARYRFIMFVVTVKHKKNGNKLLLVDVNKKTRLLDVQKIPKAPKLKK